VDSPKEGRESWAEWPEHPREPSENTKLRKKKPAMDSVAFGIPESDKLKRELFEEVAEGGLSYMNH